MLETLLPSDRGSLISRLLPIQGDEEERHSGAGNNGAQEAQRGRWYADHVIEERPEQPLPDLVVGGAADGERYLTMVFDSVGQLGSYDSFIGDPAIYGLTATLRF